MTNAQVNAQAADNMLAFAARVSKAATVLSHTIMDKEPATHTIMINTAKKHLEMM